MSKSTQARKSAIASTAAAAAVIASAATETPTTETSAPVAETKTPRVKRAKGEIGGPAFDKLVAAGASLIRIAGTGQLHNVVLSNLSPVVPVADLPKIVPPLVGGWAQFDSGYLLGGHASYDAAAVDICSKKAKTNPAFTYARQNESGEIELLAANGTVWSRSDKEGRSQSTYDRAMQAARVAFAPAPVEG